MAKQRKGFRFRLPWRSEAPYPRSLKASTAEPQNPTQPTTGTTPAQRPPFPRLDPELAPPPQAQPSSPPSAATGSRVTSQPASPSRASATQSWAASQAPSRSRVTPHPQVAPQPSSLPGTAIEIHITSQADPQPQSPPKLASDQPAVQTSSLPSSPSLKATQEQSAAGAVTQTPPPLDKLHPTTQEGSQPPPVSTEPPMSVPQEEPKPARSQPESLEPQAKAELQTTTQEGSQPPPVSSEPPMSVSQEEPKPARSQPESPKPQPKTELQPTTQERSQSPPISSKPPISISQEEPKPVRSQPESPEPQPKAERTSENVLNPKNQTPSQMSFQPNGMPAQPSEASVPVAAATPTSPAAVETLAPTQKSDSSIVSDEHSPLQESDENPEVKIEGKVIVQELRNKEKINGVSEEPKQSTVTELLLPEQNQLEKEEILRTRTVISHLRPKNQVSESRHNLTISNVERAPLHKEIMDNISRFVHKMATQQPKYYSMGEIPVSVITLAGENRGASIRLASETAKTEGAEKSTETEEDQASKAYINNNVQGINNSIMFNSSITERNPGVKLVLSRNLTESIKPMAKKSKILIIGGTGYIGKFIVEASAKAGHPTFALVRGSTVSDPVKEKLIESFKNSGVNLLHGDLYDHESLVNAVKLVDVVISTVGAMQLADQVKIIAAIKEAGNVKRFFPSEFGNDVDRVNAVDPAKSLFAIKAQFRRAVEAEGIPHTYVSSNYFAGYFLPTLAQPGLTAPPRDKAIIPGDGNPKAIFNEEHDIGTYTIKAVDDPRTLNKILYIRPPKNTYSFNELVSLWEKKIGKTLERIYIPEEQLLKQIQESPIPSNVILSINHSVFVRGDQTNFEIEPSFGVEASELYPDVKYTTVEEYLDQFV